MRYPLALRAAAFLALLLAVASCRDDTPSGPSVAGPSYNHVRWLPASAVVDANALQLYVEPDALRRGYRNGVITLYHGGLTFGTSDTSLLWFDTRNGRSGLSPMADMRVHVPGPVADHQTVSLLLPTGPRGFPDIEPPTLVVVRQTFAFAAPPDDDYVIVKYTLFNPAPWSVNGLFAGQVLDQDVGPDAASNFVQWIDPEQSVRHFSVPATLWTGHVMLGEDPSVHRFYHNGNHGSPDDDARTPAVAFGYLSGALPGPTLHGPMDVRDLLSTGPFDLASGMSRVVAFALVADDSWDAVGNGIAAARSRWNALPAAARLPYPVMTATMVAVPVTIQLDAPGPMQVHLTFATAASAALLDGTAMRCAGARPTRLLRHGARVIAFLERSALDPGRIRDQFLICGGWATDGSAWVAAARVTLIANAGTLHEPALVTRLTTDPGNETHASWSPDGQSIAFDGNRAGMTGVWHMDLAGGEATARLLVPVAAASTWPDWSPDGRSIAFRSPDGLYTVPANGGTPTRLGDSGGMPAWSRDGASVAFARNNALELWLMDVATGAERIVATEPSNMYPEWGPDGLLYFVAGGRSDDALQAIVRVDPASGTVARVTPIEGVANSAPSIAPDGRTLAFASDVPGVGRRIVFQDLRTGQHTLLGLEPSVEPADRLEYSPDGRRLLFSSGGDIYVADLPRWAWRQRP